jgi:hypothetical protein
VQHDRPRGWRLPIASPPAEWYRGTGGAAMRIRFNSDEDRIKGNYVLLMNTVSRVYRGDVFEIADEDKKLLDDNHLNYTIIPVDQYEPDNEIRVPITYEIQRRHAACQLMR